MSGKSTGIANASAATENVGAGQAAASTAKTSAVSPNTRMGVVRYLQLKPKLSGGMKAVMRNKYQSEVHTFAEWEGLLEYTQNRTIK